MLRNYLKIAFRNLWKNKGYSAINIMGLAVGIATCLLICLYVLDELSFDRSNDKAGRIYRVNADLKFGGEEQKFAVTPDPMAFTFVKDYPEVENAVRFRNYGPSLVKKGNENIKEEKIIYTDSTLFEVFTLPMIAGDPHKALASPNTVVITESIAKKYFDDPGNAMGQVLRFDNRNDFKVTGVIKDVPGNSHINFDFYVALAGVREANQNIWLSFNFNTYLLLRKDADVSSFRKKFEAIMAKYMWPQAEQFMHITRDDFKKSGNYIRLSLMPLTDIHLHSDRVAELSPNSDIQVVYIFSVIAIFILLVACVNFMNLSTARSANRAKEVGVRKVLGTQRKNLVSQFLTEAVVMSLIAFVFATGIALLLLPYLNSLALKNLSLSVTQHPWLFPLLIGFAIIVGLLAGVYPALYLSAFRPIKVLKGTLSAGFKKSYLRSGLVVFQFFISMVLIVSTIIIYNQLGYIRNKKLGFNKEQVVIVKDAYVLDKQAETFRQEVMKYPEIVSGTKSGYLPVNGSRDNESLFAEGHIENDKAVSSQLWTVDHEYVKTLGMQVVQGRDFSKDLPTDSSAIILNETAVRLFGFKGDAVGKKVTRVIDLKTKATQDYTVIGVVKNFHFESLRQNIGSLCLIVGKDINSISFRTRAAEMGQALDHIRSSWKRIAPGEPFAYSFLDEEFDNMYRSEQRAGKIFMSFAILAIFIACLGLFGLAAYAAEQRTREIGIRKVLGATVSNIVAMLSKDFLKLVVIASLVAIPVAWWLMSKWLQDFAYRVSISWWVFLSGMLVAVAIALFTVSFQAIKAAIANPIKGLRSE